MTHQKTKYLCDFCNREYAVEKNAERHESECYHNPDNQACATCKYYAEQTEEHHQTWLGEDHVTFSRGYGCELDAMPYLEGQPMPTHHCGKYEPKGAQS